MCTTCVFPGSFILYRYIDNRNLRSSTKSNRIIQEERHRKELESKNDKPGTKNWKNDRKRSISIDR